VLSASGDKNGTILYTLVTAPNPAYGTLLLRGVVLTAGSTFTQAQINSGLLSYHNLDEVDNGGTDSFSFIVSNASKPGGVAGIFVLHIKEVPVTAIANNALSATAGRSATLQTATFFDPPGPEAIGKYSATIDWGDHSATSGTIGMISGTNRFSVTGSHTYTRSGRFTVTTTIFHGGTVSTVKSKITVNSFAARLTLFAPAAISTPAAAMPASVSASATPAPAAAPAATAATLPTAANHSRVNWSAQQRAIDQFMGKLGAGLLVRP
jgi:hypothetical protein